MKYLALLLISLPAFGQFGAASRILSGTGAPVAAQCTVENNVGLVWARKDGADAGTTFYVCGATGVGTYGWELRGGAPGGGAALSTVGSVPFVTSSGVLGQDADFSFASATDRMIAGNASVGSNAAAYTGYAVWAHKDQQSAAGIALLQGPSGDTYLNSAATAALVFRIGATEGFRLAPTTRNLLLGTTTDDGVNRLQVAGSMAGAITSAVSNRDGATSLRLSTSLAATAVPATVGARITFSQRWFNSDSGVIRVGAINGWKTNSDGGFGGGVQLYHQSVADVDLSPTLSTFHTGDVAIGTTTNGNFRLDVASSGSSGTTRIYDQTPTTGSTSLVVRAGAGQGSNNLQVWQDSAGTALAFINSGGNSIAQGFLTSNFFDIGSTGRIRFSNSADPGTTKDLSLSRASANTLQVGDGGSNSNGTILARIYTWANGTEGTCDSTLRGQVVMVQGGAGVADTFRVCRKDAANAYAWTALY